ncbi:hypothetical protein BY458DRAFT_441187 [Sporodiniella umbellata]|nr:hypothetical protein BY458DRAFT_441187 [Sporodiniella umbellata]
MAQALNDAAARNLGAKILIRKVLNLADDLRKHNTPFDSETFEHLLSAYSKGGHYDKITMLLHMMEAHNIKPRRKFFDTALKLAARFGNSSLQASLLLYMEKYGFEKTSKTYRYMLSCMRENSELERALDTIQEMKDNNMEPSALSYLEIVQLAVLMRQPLVAFELLCSAKRMDEYPGHSEFLHLSILRSAAYHGEVNTL